jgi:hypothetical protein
VEWYAIEVNAGAAGHEGMLARLDISSLAPLIVVGVESMRAWILQFGFARKHGHDQHSHNPPECCI